MEKLKTQIPNIIIALVLTIIMTCACNIIGYDFSLED